MTPRQSLHVGIVILGVAAATVLLLPPTFLTPLLAAGAWFWISRDDRYGPLPAAIAVVLALPYDRAADLQLPRMLGIPIRSQDVVIALAILAAIPALRRLRLTPMSWILAGFLAVGVMALVVGIIGDNAGRDILRDARWWSLYATGLVVSAARIQMAALLRGILVGTAMFAALVVVATVTPGLEGGLKARAMDFDAGLLRMQFGPTLFLLIPLAFLTARIVVAARWRLTAPLLLLYSVAAGLSLTRTFIIVAIGVIGLSALLSLRGTSFRIAAPRGAAAFTISLVGIAMAVAMNAVGVRIPEIGAAPDASPALTVAARPTPSDPPADILSPDTEPSPAMTPFQPQSPFDRFIPDATRVMWSLGGRFASYENATALVSASPWIGHGLGTLVDVNYEFGAGRFDTPGKLPNVDNAYLTIAMKAGLIGVAAFATLCIGFAVSLWRRDRTGRVRFLLAAWIGVLILTFTQSFAVIGYSPFVLGAILLADPFDHECDGGA